MCCSVLQCVALCSRCTLSLCMETQNLHCVAVQGCTKSWSEGSLFSPLPLQIFQCVAACCSVCCTVLQCVALCPLSLCMDFQKFALRCSAGLHKILVWGLFVFTMNSPKFAVYCREFQCVVAVCCNGGLRKNRSLGALPFSFTTNTQNVPPHRNKHRNIRKCVRKLELK